MGPISSEYDSDDTLVTGAENSPRTALGVLNATLRNSAPPGGDHTGEHAIGVLGELGPKKGVALHGTLGEGSMGVVRLGTQIALGRTVAVKSVRDEKRSPAATLKLLREAWVTGSLEHPNIVPVYDVSLDAAQNPQIVLKKIDGALWFDLMGDAARVKQRFHSSDLLEWNIGILSQTAHALHFAHSRGVLHRDLKPENVMIGEFGEVYVIDWGIAVSLHDDGTGRLPLASEATELAGTLCYMAPEMLGTVGMPLTRRSDVYLLGAVLYEIACGHPPHDATTFDAICAQIIRSEPPIPPEVPPELARIIRRAMDRDPDARFETAEQFRLALTGFLSHRGSTALSTEANTRLTELEVEVARPMTNDDARRLRLYHLFGECQFGFRQALRQWGENPDAAAGLRRALLLMIEVELTAGDPKAAALLLAQIEQPPAELVQRIDAARRRRELEDARLASLKLEHDRDVGRGTRASLGVLLGSVWNAGPIGMLLLSLFAPTLVSHTTVVVHAAALFLFVLVVGSIVRSRLARTAIDRQLAQSIVMGISVQLVFCIGASLAGVSLPATLATLLVVWTVVVASTSIAVAPGVWPSAVVFCVAFLVASVFPRAVSFVTVLANAAFTVNVFRVHLANSRAAAAGSGTS